MVPEEVATVALATHTIANTTGFTNGGVFNRTEGIRLTEIPLGDTITGDEQYTVTTGGVYVFNTAHRRVQRA
jgi:hypothetical protein